MDAIEKDYTAPLVENRGVLDYIELVYVIGAVRALYLNENRYCRFS